MKRGCIVVAALVACSEPKPAPTPSPRPPPTAVAPVAPNEDLMALAQAVALRDGVLVRTDAGNLARYSNTLELVTHKQIDPKVAAIAVAGPQAYAVLRDGQVVRITEALAIERIATIKPGEPRWIEAHGDELLVFSVGKPKRSRLDRVKLDGQVKSIDVPTGTSAASEIGRPSTFLLERDRVWFGIDAGEWGGALGRIDLKTSAVTMFKGDPGPIFGMVTVNDRVLIYGGLIHMTATSGFITEIADNKLVPRFTRDAIGLEDVRPTNPEPLPVVKVAPHGAGLRVLVWHELFDVSSDFKTWTKVAATEAREHQGRPDSVGNYPATASMIEVGGTTVLATVKDGLWSLRDGRLLPIPR